MQQMLTSMETNEVEGEFDGRDLFLASKRLEEFSMQYAKHHVNISEVLITRGNTVGTLKILDTILSKKRKFWLENKKYV